MPRPLLNAKRLEPVEKVWLTLFVVPCAYSLFSKIERKKYHPETETKKSLDERQLAKAL